MSENYIVINGKRKELTEEDLEKLGYATEPNPFAMNDNNDETYYFITSYGTVTEASTFANKYARYNVANYCTDREIMKQRVLHENLNRLLWRYSMEHKEGKGKWSNLDMYKYIIKKDAKGYHVVPTNTTVLGAVHFCANDIAEDAVKEIIEPFIKKHPDFVW